MVSARLTSTMQSCDYLQLVRRCYVERYLPVCLLSHLCFYVQKSAFCTGVVSKDLLMFHHYKCKRENMMKLKQFHYRHNGGRDCTEIRFVMYW